mgnify:CR=1 FL=1
MFVLWVRKQRMLSFLKEMIKSGMNVARFNFSHGSHEEHAGRMALVEEARKAVNIPVATMLDTKGPEIRTGSVPGDKKVTLVEGQDFDLTIDQSVETTQKAHLLPMKVLLQMLKLAAVF